MRVRAIATTATPGGGPDLQRIYNTGVLTLLAAMFGFFIWASKGWIEDKDRRMNKIESDVGAIYRQLDSLNVKLDGIFKR